jgi:uncharacterized membrane protein YcjF (UPF0283 family)
MNDISLLLCKSTTERHDELNSWLYVALAAMVLVIVGAGSELIILEIAFVLALCMRQGAMIAAKAIRRSVNVNNAIGVMARTEGRQIQRCADGINHVKSVTARRRSSESRQACFASLGLFHLCLASRLLPLPVSIAR